MKINPNTAAEYNGIFGLPEDKEHSLVHYLAVPWDVTTSYGKGTAKGPESLLKASPQIDLFDLDFGQPWKKGLYFHHPPANIKKLNNKARALAEKIINQTHLPASQKKKNIESVNLSSDELNRWVYQRTKDLLKLKKKPVLIGGDHSTPFGAIKAYSEKFPGMGILHLDAHSDTRASYMGFTHSHASIMYNVAERLTGIKKIVQVGIRDFCEEEYAYTKKNKLFNVFYDKEIRHHRLEGKAFSLLAKKIIKELPKKIYLSFDIDALDPRYCPNTGTPVPGGLDFQEVIYLIEEIRRAKKQLIGFDLVEVAPGKHDEWDANVGMRLLYKLTGAMLAGPK